MFGFAGTLGDLEDFVFRFVEQLRRITSLRVIGVAGDVGAYLCELAHNRALAHDFGITADVGGRRGVLCKGNQIIETARGIELVFAGQRLLYGDDVGRPVFVNQGGDAAENQPVFVAVEVFAAEYVGDSVPCFVFKQQAAKNRLLGFH